MAHGGILDSLRSDTLHHSVSFLLRNFYSEYEPFMNPLSAKLCFLWLRAVLGLFFGGHRDGTGGILGPLCLGILHHATHLSLRGFDTKFESSI